MKVRCYHCGYEWDTESLKLNVTCPNCLRKVFIEKAYKGF